jgi:hypothetical protein
MGVSALSKEESKIATKLALRHMSRVEGVKRVNVMEDWLEVETSPASGIAYIHASVNQAFIDNRIDKKHSRFTKGQQLHDDYYKFYNDNTDNDDDSESKTNWMIGIIKHKSFFSTKYEATSALLLGDYQYLIGHKEGLSSLEQVFEHLCYEIIKIPRD